MSDIIKTALGLWISVTEWITGCSQPDNDPSSWELFAMALTCLVRLAVIAALVVLGVFVLTEVAEHVPELVRAILGL